MSKTKRLTVSSLVAALCVAALSLTAVIPRVTLALTALAGIFPAVVIIACGFGWGVGTVIAAALIGLLLLPEKTAVLWFVLFFGHYPFWKLVIERLQTRLGKPWLGWIMKVAGFAACMMLLFFLFNAAFTSAVPMSLSSNVLKAAALGILCVCFILYDVAFSILIGFFRIRILPRLR